MDIIATIKTMETQATICGVVISCFSVFCELCCWLFLAAAQAAANVAT